MTTSKRVWILGALLLSMAIAARAQVTASFMATDTTWDVGFNDLQTPGWVAHWGGHPGGSFGLQWKSLYVEGAADPHRPREATSAFGGVRHDIFHYKRAHFYGQGGLGMFMAPSFLDYCGSYEYRNGDCGAGNQEPEYCWWFTLHAGIGLRVHLGKGVDWEVGRFEYIDPYAISPRYRFSTGVSFCIAGCPK